MEQTEHTDDHSNYDRLIKRQELLRERTRLRKELHTIETKLESLELNHSPESLRTTIEGGVDRLSSILPYQQFLRELHKWMPGHHKTRFREKWEFLQMRKIMHTPGVGKSFIPPEMIIKWMDYAAETEDMIAKGIEVVEAVGFVPPEVEYDIQYLAFIRYVNSLKKKEGLTLLTDERFANILSGGSWSEGVKREPGVSIRKICECFKTFEFKKVDAIIRLLANSETSQAGEKAVIQRYEKRLSLSQEQVLRLSRTINIIGFSIGTGKNKKGKEVAGFWWDDLFSTTDKTKAFYQFESLSRLLRELKKDVK